ncbi:hypothetical protein AALA58_00495 [Lactococcus ileimucosae]
MVFYRIENKASLFFIEKERRGYFILSEHECVALEEKIQKGQVLSHREQRLIFLSLDKRLGYNTDGTSRIIEKLVDLWLVEIFG